MVTRALAVWVFGNLTRNSKIWIHISGVDLTEQLLYETSRRIAIHIKLKKQYWYLFHNHIPRRCRDWSRTSRSLMALCQTHQSTVVVAAVDGDRRQHYHLNRNKAKMRRPRAAGAYCLVTWTTVGQCHWCTSKEVHWREYLNTNNITCIYNKCTGLWRYCLLSCLYRMS